MPYLYRAERLSVLKKFTRQLYPDLDVFKGEYGFFDPDIMESHYKKLESQLYDASKLDDLDNKMDEIEAALFRVLANLKKPPLFYEGLFRTEIKGSSFAPFMRAAFGLSTQFNLNRARRSHKHPALGILLNFPLIRDIWGYDRTEGAYLRDEIISNLILSLLNPVKLVHDFLTFLDASVDRFLEIGLTRDNPTPIPQAFLKGVVGFAIGVIKIPVAILRPFSDVLPWLVNNLLIQPVKYLTNKGLRSLKKRPEPDLSAYEKVSDFNSECQKSDKKVTQRSSFEPVKPSAQSNANKNHSPRFFSGDIDQETGAHLEEKDNSHDSRFGPGGQGS